MQIFPEGVATRHTVLRVPRPQHYDFLHELALQNPRSWSWSRRQESAENLSASIWEGTTANCVVEDRRSGTPLGYIVISDLNAYHEFADLSAYFAQQFRGWLYPLEGLILFLDFAFQQLPLQNLYMETSSSIGEQFAGHLLAPVEARLSEKYRRGAGREDAVICRLSKSLWNEHRAGLIRHSVGSAEDDVRHTL